MLRTARGETVALGREIASGGEGMVHEVPGRPGLLAKLYRTPPDGARCAKLAAMVATPAQLRPTDAAWPAELLLRGGQVAGFLMPRAMGRRELHDLFSPAARKRHFPKVDYRFLVAAAANLARAFASVHAAGAVIGDVNERLALVDARATVVLIDCDSFQFTAGGQILTCDVGVPNYQPPELQGRAFRGLERSRNHDLFGLAVLVFQILFFGRHPFSGSPLSGEPLEPGEAIRVLQFAWGPGAARRGVRQPPRTLPLASLSGKLPEFFERAFSEQGIQEGRPRAEAWARALDEFAAALRRCRQNTMHWHAMAACPLCALQGELRATALFIPPTMAVRLPDLRQLAARLWQEIEAAGPLPAWQPAPPLDTYRRHVMLPPLPAELQRPGLLARIAAPLGVGPALSWRKERALREAALARAQADHERAMQRWADLRQLRSRQVLEEARKVREELVRLADHADTALGLANDQMRRQQLYQYLERFELADAYIEGIGAGRKRTLAGAGIETAADVEFAALSAVPGFGPVLRQRIVTWRNECARHFVFDPNAALDPALVAQVAGEVASRAAGLEARLRALAGALRDAITAETKDLQAARRAVQAAAVALVRADAERDQMG